VEAVKNVAHNSNQFVRPDGGLCCQHLPVGSDTEDLMGQKGQKSVMFFDADWGS
jgi:hypothetical protein